MIKINNHVYTLSTGTDPNQGRYYSNKELLDCLCIASDSATEARYKREDLINTDVTLINGLREFLIHFNEYFFYIYLENKDYTIKEIIDHILKVLHNSEVPISGLSLRDHYTQAKFSSSDLIKAEDNEFLKEFDIDMDGQRYGLKSFEKIINEEKKTICFKNKLTFDHKEGNTVYPIVMYRSEVDTDDTNVENEEFQKLSQAFSSQDNMEPSHPSDNNNYYDIWIHTISDETISEVPVIFKFFNGESRPEVLKASEVRNKSEKDFLNLLSSKLPIEIRKDYNVYLKPNYQEFREFGMGDPFGMQYQHPYVRRRHPLVNNFFNREDGLIVEVYYIPKISNLEIKKVGMLLLADAHLGRCCYGQQFGHSVLAKGEELKVLLETLSKLRFKSLSITNKSKNMKIKYLQSLMPVEVILPTYVFNLSTISDYLHNFNKNLGFLSFLNIDINNKNVQEFFLYLYKHYIHSLSLSMTIGNMNAEYMHSDKLDTYMNFDKDYFEKQLEQNMPFYQSTAIQLESSMPPLDAKMKPSILLFNVNHNKNELVSINQMDIFYMKSSSFMPYCIPKEEHYTKIDSLGSAFIYGMDSICYDTYYGFSNLTGKKFSFYLPLLPHSSNMNIMKMESSKKINFYCLKFDSNTKSTFVHIKGIGCLNVNGDYAIVHSTEDRLSYIYHNQQYEIKPYRTVEPIKALPYFNMTEDAKNRMKCVHDAYYYNIPTLIEGDTSSGKTYTVEQMVKQALLPFIKFSMSPSSTIEELVGEVVLKMNNNQDKDKAFVYKNGSFTEAFIKGYVFLIDEMSLGQSILIQTILSNLSTKQIFIDEMDEYKMYDMNPFFRIIATQNPAGSNYKRSILSHTVKDYFRIPTLKDFPSMKTEELKAIMSKNSHFQNIPDIMTRSKLLNILCDNHLNHQDNSDIISSRCFTIRDMNRTMTLFSLLREQYPGYSDLTSILKAAMHITYGDPLEQPLEIPVLENGPLSEAELMPELYKNVCFRLDNLLKSGCNVIISSDDEYTARFYTLAYLNSFKENGFRMLYCNSSVASESLIGTTVLTKSSTGLLKNKPVPVWKDSDLVTCVKDGKIILFESMHTMLSNNLERLNSLFEISLSPDAEVQHIRFDEKQDNPIVDINNNFRVIATASIKGLNKFSPALNNRFVHIYIPKSVDPLVLPKSYLIESMNDVLRNNKYYQLCDNISQCNEVMKLTFKKSLKFVYEVVCNEDAKKLESYSQMLFDFFFNGQHLPFFESKLRCSLLEKMFMSILYRPVTVLVGRKGCGKSHLLHTFIDALDIKNSTETFYLSMDTEVNQLFGSYNIGDETSSTSFQPGPLLNAYQNGKILILENAENLTEGLLESLDQFVDPFSKTLRHLGVTYARHRNFRLILSFSTVKQDEIRSNLPVYYNIINTDFEQKSEIESILDNESILCKLYEKNFFSLRCLIFYKMIAEALKPYNRDLAKEDPNLFLCYVITLFQPSYNNKESALYRLLSELYLSDATKQESFKEFLYKEVTTTEITYSYEKACLTRNRLCVPLSEELNKRVQSSKQYFLQTLLRYAIVELVEKNLKDRTNAVINEISDRTYIRHLGVLLEGASSKEDFLKDYLEKYEQVEFARSLEVEHILGYISVSSANEIEEICLNADATVNEGSITYKKWLEGIKKAKRTCTKSMMIFKPGQLTSVLFRNTNTFLDHIELLSPQLQPRIRGLIESYCAAQPFVIHEDITPLDVTLDNVQLFASLEESSFTNFGLRDHFLYIPCEDYSKSDKQRLFTCFKDLPNIEEIPYHILHKASSIAPFFKRGAQDALFYVNYVSENESNRPKICQSFKHSRELEKFLTEEIDFNDPAATRILRDVFKECIVNDIEEVLRRHDDEIDNKKNNTNSGFYPTHTTLLLLSTLVLGSRAVYSNNSNNSTSTLPIILEGAPGVGKSDATMQLFYMLSRGDKARIFRKNFSTNVDVASLFGQMTIHDSGTGEFKYSDLSSRLKESKQMIYILFDELNLASPELLDEIAILIRCSYLGKPFHIPGSDIKIDKLPPIVFVISQNPASMSSSRAMLPSSIVDISLFHKNINFSDEEKVNLSFSLVKKQFESYLNLYRSKIENNSMEERDRYITEFEEKIEKVIRQAQNLGIANLSPLTIRDVLKILSVWDTRVRMEEKSRRTLLLSDLTSSINTPFWLVLASKYSADERQKFEKSIGFTLNNLTIKEDEDSGKIKGIVFETNYGNTPLNFLTNRMPSEYSTLLFEKLTNSEKLLMYQLTLSLNTNHSILVYGSSPSGKSHCIRNLAKICGQKAIFVPLNSESTASVLFGRSKPNLTSNISDQKTESESSSSQDSENLFQFRYGPLLDAIKNGYWLVIEDINLAQGDVLESLNSLLEENPTLNYTEGTKSFYCTSKKDPKHDIETQDDNQTKKNRETIIIHKNFKLFMTSSDNLLTRISLPLQSRCILLNSENLSTKENIDDICDCYYPGDPSNKRNATGKNLYAYLTRNNKDFDVSFRTVLRIINSEELLKDSYKREFHEELGQPREVQKKSQISNPIDRFIDAANSSPHSKLIKKYIKDMLHEKSADFNEERKKEIRKIRDEYYQTSTLYYPLKTMEGLWSSVPAPLIDSDIDRNNHLRRWGLFYDYDLDKKLMKKKAVNLKRLFERKEEENPFDYLKFDSSYNDYAIYSYMTSSEKQFLKHPDIFEFIDIYEKLFRCFDSAIGTDDDNIRAIYQDIFNALAEMCTLFRDSKRQYDGIKNGVKNSSQGSGDIRSKYNKFITKRKDLKSLVGSKFIVKSMFKDFYDALDFKQNEFHKFLDVDFISSNSQSSSIKYIFSPSIDQELSELKSNFEYLSLSYLYFELLEVNATKISSFLLNTNAKSEHGLLESFGINENLSLQLEGDQLKKLLRPLIDYKLNCLIQKNSRALLFENFDVLDLVKNYSFRIHTYVSEEELYSTFKFLYENKFFKSSILNISLNSNGPLDHVALNQYLSAIHLLPYDEYVYKKVQVPFKPIFCMNMLEAKDIDPKLFSSDNLYYLCNIEKEDKLYNTYELVSKSEYAYLLPGSTMNKHDNEVILKFSPSHMSHNIEDFKQSIWNNELFDGPQKLSLICPYKSTAAAVALNEILKTDFYSDFINEPIKNSTNFDELFQNLCAAQDVVKFKNLPKLKEAIDKREKDINDRKLKLEERKCNHSECLESLKKAIKNCIDEKNKESCPDENERQRTQLYKDWYLTQHYNKSWNEFVSSVSFPDDNGSFDPKNSFNEALSTFTTINANETRKVRNAIQTDDYKNEMAFISTKKSCYTSIKVCLVHLSKKKEVTYSFKLYMDDNTTLAPVQFKEHQYSIVNNSQDSASKSYYSLIVYPMSTYNVKINFQMGGKDKGKNAHVWTKDYYVTYPLQFSHMMRTEDNDNGRICNCLLDVMISQFCSPDAHLLYDLDENILANSETLNKIEPLPNLSNIYNVIDHETFFRYKGMKGENEFYKLKLADKDASFSLPHYFYFNNNNNEIDCYSVPLFAQAFTDHDIPDLHVLNTHTFIEDDVYEIKRDGSIDILGRNGWSWTQYHDLHDRINKYNEEIIAISTYENNLHSEEEKQKEQLDSLEGMAKFMIKNSVFVDMDDSNDDDPMTNDETSTLKNAIVLLSGPNVPVLYTPIENGFRCYRLSKCVKSYHKQIVSIPLLNPDSLDVTVHPGKNCMSVTNNNDSVSVTLGSEDESQNGLKHSSFFLECGMASFEIHLVYELDCTTKIFETDTPCTIREYKNEERSRLLLASDNNLQIYYDNSITRRIMSNPAHHIKLFDDSKNDISFEPNGFGAEDHSMRLFTITDDCLDYCVLKTIDNEVCFIDPSLGSMDGIVSALKEKKSFTSYMEAFDLLYSKLSIPRSHIPQCLINLLESVNKMVHYPIYEIASKCQKRINDNNVDFNIEWITNRDYNNDKFNRLSSNKNNGNSLIESQERNIAYQEAMQKLNDAIDTIREPSKGAPTLTRSLTRHDSVKPSSQSMLSNSSDDDDDDIQTQEKNTVKQYVDEPLDDKDVQEEKKYIGFNELLKKLINMPIDDYFQKEILRKADIKNDTNLMEVGENDLKEIKVLSTGDSKSHDLPKELQRGLYQYASTWIQQILKASSEMNLDKDSDMSGTNSYARVKKLMIVLDLSFTHKRTKSKLRSILALILLIICDELNIKYRVICNGIRNKALDLNIAKYRNNFVYKAIRVLSLENEYTFLFNSTPLDLCTLHGRNKSDVSFDDSKMIILSDCFSEQLLVTEPEVKTRVQELAKKVFILHLLPSPSATEEQLSPENSQKMLDLLHDNFKDHILSIREDQINDVDLTNLATFFYEKTDAIQYPTVDESMPFESPKVDKNKSLESPTVDKNKPFESPKVDKNKSLKSQPKKGNSLLEVNDSEWIKDNGYVVLSTNISGSSVKLPDVDSKSLTILPPISKEVDDFLKDLSNVNNEHDLFDSMATGLFIPNKPTSYIASTSGSTIHLRNFINFIITGTGNGKIFKKKAGNKIRNYSVSMVIDNNQFAFSDMNRHHSLLTILYFLHAFSALNISAFDLWIAKSSPIRVCTGLEDNQIWTNNTIQTLLTNLKTSSETRLIETIRHAVSTSMSRPSESVIFVFTNGIENPNYREYLHGLISQCDCTIIGVGIGLNCQHYQDLFKSFLWCSQTKYLGKAIQTIGQSTEKTDCSTVCYSSMSFSTIHNGLFKLTMSNGTNCEEQMIQQIRTLYLDIQFEIQKYFFNSTNDSDQADVKENPVGNEYDLAPEKAYSGVGVLFIILYLARKENIDGKNEQLDAAFTREALEKGPQKKLNDKGYTVDYAYNYHEAIDKLCTGKYKVTVITCSPGDGEFPHRGDIKYLHSFIYHLHRFNQNGGGLFWLLENYPYTFEADYFFNYTTHYNNITYKDCLQESFYIGANYTLDKLILNDKEAKGGENLIHDDPDSKVIHNGKFKRTKTMLCEDGIQRARLDQGLFTIFEGKSLPVLNEEGLSQSPYDFHVFARDHEGNACIMTRYEKGNFGRMIVDTGASKLFEGFTADGTARYISNAVTWLVGMDIFLRSNPDCNVKDPITGLFNVPEEYKGVKVYKEGESKDDRFFALDVEERKFEKPVKLFVSVIVDLSGSMFNSFSDVIKSVNAAIKDLKDRVEKTQSKNQCTVMARVTGYRDLGGDLQKPRFIDSDLYTNDFTTFEEDILQPTLKNKDKKFKSVGGGSTWYIHNGNDSVECKCDKGCHNFCGGLIEAFHKIKGDAREKYPNANQHYKYFKHIMVMITRSGMHGLAGVKAKDYIGGQESNEAKWITIGDDESCNFTQRYDDQDASKNVSFDQDWKDIYHYFEDFPDLKLYVYGYDDKVQNTVNYLKTRLSERDNGDMSGKVIYERLGKNENDYERIKAELVKQFEELIKDCEAKDLTAG